MKRREMFSSVLVILAVFGLFSIQAKDKVVHVESYHEGYPWSDGLVDSIRQTLGDRVDLTLIRLDANRHPDETYQKQVAMSAREQIEALNPSVIIASDDAAQKYLIVPHFLNKDIPVVFCGVNWDASGYGYPSDNVTGMIEVTPIDGLIELMKKITGGSRIGFIGPDVITVHKEYDNIQKVFGIQPVAHFAKDYEDYKRGFLDLQDKTDFIILDADGGMYNDFRTDRLAFFAENTRKPTGTCYGFMADFAILTFAKKPEEQGTWAAEQALRIIEGVSPRDIPIVRNTQGALIINAKLAEMAGIEIPYSIIELAQSVIQ